MTDMCQKCEESPAMGRLMKVYSLARDFLQVSGDGDRDTQSMKRLRAAVVEASDLKIPMMTLWDQTIETKKNSDEQKVRETNMSVLLAKIASNLKGVSGKDTIPFWSELPELVADLKKKVEQAQEALSFRTNFEADLNAPIGAGAALVAEAQELLRVQNIESENADLRKKLVATQVVLTAMAKERDIWQKLAEQWNSAHSFTREAAVGAREDFLSAKDALAAVLLRTESLKRENDALKAELGAAKQKSVALICGFCESAPATCTGTYFGAKDVKAACDDCCAHDHEEPGCTKIVADPSHIPIPPCTDCGKDSLVTFIGTHRRRHACEDHLPGVVEFMKPMVEQGILVQNAQAERDAARKEWHELNDMLVRITAERDQERLLRTRIEDVQRADRDMYDITVARVRLHLTDAKVLIEEISAASNVARVMDIQKRALEFLDSLHEAPKCVG